MFRLALLRNDDDERADFTDDFRLDFEVGFDVRVVLLFALAAVSDSRKLKRCKQSPRDNHQYMRLCAGVDVVVSVCVCVCVSVCV